MTYKAKDRVTDRNGTVWQYNALYGTFRAHYDATGKALATYSDAITYSAEALEKQLGPLKRVVSKPRFVGRFEVTVNRGIEQPTVAGVFTALTTRNHYSDGYFGTDDKVTVKELPVERRSGADTRRVRLAPGFLDLRRQNGRGRRAGDWSLHGEVSYYVRNRDAL